MAHRAVLASGAWRFALAFVCGAFGALALSPIDLLPAMVVPMTAAVWLIDGSDRTLRRRDGLVTHLWPTLKAAAGAGWWWGFGYFVAGLWWLGSAFLMEADKFAWALPLGVLGLPAYLAIFPALGFALARLLWLPGPGRVLSFAVALGLSEAARGWALTGFPWNGYGMALADHLALAQAASGIGLAGLTLLTCMIFAVPATLADPARTARGRWLPVGLASLALAVLAGFGLWRLSGGQPGTVEGVRLRILQPNIGQGADFDYAHREEIVRRYLALSDRASSDKVSGLADITHLIWPESAFPFLLSREPDALRVIAEALPAQTTLITGAARADGPPSSPHTRYYNSIQVLGHNGTILDSYDKVHLVPFGEYLPIGGLLSRLGLSQFVHIPGGFDAGAVHRLLNVPGLAPVLPAICYEAIFPLELLPPLPDGLAPGLMINVTNDSWFGVTAGPYQHLAQVQLAAIELGLPVVRAATSGISAIIDPYGRITAHLPLGVEDVLDGVLPRPIPPTFFSRFNLRITLGIYGALLTMVFLLRYRRR